MFATSTAAQEAKMQHPSHWSFGNVHDIGSAACAKNVDCLSSKDDVLAAGTAEDARGVHLDYLLEQQQDSNRSSLEKCTSGQGLNIEDELSWEDAEPKQGLTTDFLRQRKMDMRSSLDWDFKSRRSTLVTRRGKDHGEENQSVLAGNMSQGRSQYGPSEMDMGGHSR